MVKAIAIGKVYPPIGRGMRIAIGTVSLLDAEGADRGSFRITESEAGSHILSNVKSVVVTPQTGSVYTVARGSSNTAEGYIELRTTVVGGTPIPTGGTTAIIANFVAFGGFGSV